jgi:hypothetical protein
MHKPRIRGGGKLSKALLVGAVACHAKLLVNCGWQRKFDEEN